MWAYIHIQPGEHIYGYMGGAYIWDVNWVTYLGGISWGGLYTGSILMEFYGMLKNIKALLHTKFYISFNVLRPTFFNIYKLPFLCSPSIRKIRVKVGQKNNYFSAL